ncbi:C2 domain protein (macronuclear) [Tetrahymena thermophila SB210]|uniref:C2 domain protein n=1 Tax=Tetrahymena thermophila (strain SB210) TaxID=312017 RepID=Q22EF7_TETTS|nr:C2 domain protein [Tetrahymena thermophila SB210]EAR83695.2 C2 domain protein [Tetrahymena thermophila SB210]|eukprot:XP_001031358.2 C2 domain protein [Tetrahymena thermophila SB210]
MQFSLQKKVIYIYLYYEYYKKYQKKKNQKTNQERKKEKTINKISSIKQKLEKQIKEKMIQNQQSLNEVIEMQEQIQETGEIMVYLTSVQQQKDISQINKQFQGTLMNKVIPRDLYEFFHSKVKMEKERYEKEIYQINDAKTEKTKYMQTLSVIYKLLQQYNLGREYIDFLMNFINKRPDYTKVNAVTLMYRMRLTGIIMLEHYLKYKNGNINLYDFNNVWNSLYSKIVEFNRKHQQQKINFAEQTSVVKRCESVIKQYIEEQKQFEESQNNHSISYKMHLKPTGLKINLQDSSEQKLSPNQSLQMIVKSNSQGQQELIENKLIQSSIVGQNKSQIPLKSSMQMDLMVESTPMEASSRVQQQFSNYDSQKEVRQNYLKEMQNINNDIEQEVSILIKVHYMHHLNITIPTKVVDFMDQSKKEAYLQVFYEWRKNINKKIEEISRNMTMIRNMQTQLYEIYNSHPHTISQHKQKNQKSYLEQCKKLEISFPFLLEKLEQYLKQVQQYVNHYDQCFSNRLQVTYHSDSTPVTVDYQSQKITNVELVQESVDENETGISLEETKEMSYLHDLASQSNKSKQASGSTHNLNPTEIMMTRNKSKQIKTNSTLDVNESNLINSTKIESNSQILKSKHSQELEKNKSALLNNSTLAQTIVPDPYQNAKSQYNQKIKANSSQDSLKNAIKGDMKQIPFNQSSKNSIIDNSKYPFEFNNNLKNIFQQERLLNLTNNLINESKSKFNNDQHSQEKGIIIKSDYQDMQDKLKQYHYQLKQLNERYSIHLQEFEDIIHHLKTYLYAHCFKQQQNPFLEVQNATASQIKKCTNFLEANQNFQKQIDFIEDQFLHFPSEDNLNAECYEVLRKKLKVSKQIVYESNYQNKNQDLQKKNNQQTKNRLDLNNSMQEESVQIQTITPVADQSNYNYIHNLKRYYEPCSNSKQLIQKQHQKNKDFQTKFYEDSKLIFNKLFGDSGLKSLKTVKLNQLIRNDDSLKKLFSC